MAKTILHGKVKEANKERKTEEEMGRKHQGMDKNAVWRFPEGGGKRRGMVESIVTMSSVVHRRPSRLMD